MRSKCPPWLDPSHLMQNHYIPQRSNIPDGNKLYIGATQFKRAYSALPLPKPI